MKILILSWKFAKKSILFLCLFCIFGVLQAEEKISFQSSNKQARLIELFTSQGCSSCPPAEKWINTFLQNDGLWQEFIPLAFHVDYWDYLGWKDIYAKKEFTQRQYNYKKNRNVRSVYTPAILVNGKEYRGGRFSKRQLAGILSGILEGQKLQVFYSDQSQNFELHIALLGFDIVTNVLGGENAGESLAQEFLVLKHQNFFEQKEVNINQWNIDFSLENTSLENTKEQVKKLAVAVWVSDKKSKKVVQATGFWL